jgi:hypothetical protein
MALYSPENVLALDEAEGIGWDDLKGELARMKEYAKHNNANCEEPHCPLIGLCYVYGKWLCGGHAGEFEEFMKHAS